VLLTAIVTDEQGIPIGGLSPEAFVTSLKDEVPPFPVTFSEPGALGT
jgi:hypothetical protein